MKTSGPHFFQKEVENYSEKGKHNDLSSRYFAIFWKQETKKKTHTYSQPNEQQKKKPETYA